MDYTRWVFEVLNNAGAPDAEARAALYAACRQQVAAQFETSSAKERALADLEKVIRRQEMQALYEESLNAK